jgi:hypothetical protein
MAVIAATGAIVALGNASAAAGPAGSRNDHRAISGGAALVTDVTSARSSGLRVVRPRGRGSTLIGPQWSPLAVSVRGAVAALPPARQGGFAILLHSHIARVRGVSPPVCASWSSDGSRLAFLAGRPVAYEGIHPDAPYGIRGTLWTVPVDRRGKPGRIAQIAHGLFPTRACPSWSTRGRNLAYVLQSRKTPWALRESLGGSSRKVAELRGAVPSLSGNNFAWVPNRNAILFLDGYSGFRVESGRVNSLDFPDEVVTAFKESVKHGHAADARLCRFSPNGRLLAVGIGGATAVFAASGELIRVVQGPFRGWAGNTGVLTVEPDAASNPALFLNQVADNRARRLIKDHFKEAIATDPGGKWFAYVDTTRFAVVFRSPSGAAIREVPFQFAPFMLAARSAGGVVADPVFGRF